MTRNRTLKSLLATTALTCLAGLAQAQAFPSRPIKIVTPFPAGQGPDVLLRIVADKLSGSLGQPVVIENKPGGDGIVAINAFVSAKDDHVLLFAPTSSFTAHPFLHENLPYKANDLVPITRVSNTLVTVSVPVALKIDSLDQLTALARAEPGKLNWAGVTGALDFFFAGWLKHDGLNMTKVAYRNPVDAANDLAENRVQVYEAALAIVRPQLDSGKIRLLAVTNTVRAPTEPNLPTVQEAGYPTLTVDGLVGLFGPPGMSLALRRRITADIRAVADKTIEDRLAVTGQLLNIGGPEEFAASIDEQRAKVSETAGELGIPELPQN
jgi:tripartite-type tricarboxylate transporter receptor subunit TctC